MQVRILILKHKQKKQTRKKNFIPPSFSPLLVHAVHPFVHTTLLANVPCLLCCCSGSRTLASGQPSVLDPHPNSSWISYSCPKSFRLCICGSLGPGSSLAPAGHRLGSANSKPWTCVWVAPGLFWPGGLRWMEKLALPCLWWWVNPAFPCMAWVVSPKGAESVFFMPSKITREVSLMSYEDYMCMWL